MQKFWICWLIDFNDSCSLSHQQRQEFVQALNAILAVLLAIPGIDVHDAQVQSLVLVLLLCLAHDTNL